MKATTGEWVVEGTPQELYEIIFGRIKISVPKEVLVKRNYRRKRAYSRWTEEERMRLMRLLETIPHDKVGRVMPGWRRKIKRDFPNKSYGSLSTKIWELRKLKIYKR